MTAVVDGRIRAGLTEVQVEGVTCLSLRDVQAMFGGRQSWERVSRRVTYEAVGHRVQFTLDTSTAAVDGRPVAMELPARWWTGQVYVPVSFLLTPEFQNAFETSTRWDRDARSLTVETVPAVSSPRFYSYPEKSRVVLELSPRVSHRVMGYRDRRLTVRFFGGRSAGRERLEVKDGLVESIQLSARGHSSDLVLTLAPEAGTPRLRLETVPHRFIVDVSPKSDVPGESVIEPDAAPAPGISMAPPPAPRPFGPRGTEADEDEDLPPAVLSPLLALSPVKTIVIDAGHGGKDAGAVGRNGTLEKDVNLEVARALARVLKRERRFTIVMTRNDDTFIPLEERTDIANRHRADLFISVHSNSALSSRSDGFEIYFLSEKATDAAAASVARRENDVIELEGITGKAKQKVQELLWSLAKTVTMNESSQLAALMNRQVERRVGIPNRGVKQAGFYVLKGANMPAVLVESAFISHPREEGLLRSRRFQNKVADGLYAGVLEYEKRKIQEKLPGKAAAYIK